MIEIILLLAVVLGFVVVMTTDGAPGAPKVSGSEPATPAKDTTTAG